MEEQFRHAMELKIAGNIQEALKLLRPLAEANHFEAQAALGCMLFFGDHRFSSYKEMETWQSEASEEDLAEFHQCIKDDIKEGVKWIRNASDHGVASATHNLAMFCLSGKVEVAADERRDKVKALLAKAREQGFSFFGGEHGDENYLRTLEDYAEEEGCGMPWEKEKRTGN